MVLLRDLGLVAFLALTHSANAFYSKNGDVLNLDEKSFKKEILLSEHAAVSIVETRAIFFLSMRLIFYCELGLTCADVLGGRVNTPSLIRHTLFE